MDTIMVDVKKLQKAIGVKVDDILGINTYIAMFCKCGAVQTRAADLAVCANRYYSEYGLLVSNLRFAHFMGQLIHESGSFRYMEEIASGSAYEGRADLGNVSLGDGVRFKGRGPIQITGRSNYRYFGRKIGIDVETNPTLASIPSVGLHLSLEYWKDRRLNDLADSDDIQSITRKINGGLNGLADRKKHVQQIKKWLE